MKHAFKCPKCGYKNYLTKDDVDRKRKALAPIPYLDEEKPYVPGIYLENDFSWVFQDIREAMYTIKQFFKSA